MNYSSAPATHGRTEVVAGWLRHSVAWAAQRPWLALPVLALPALWPFVERGLTGSHDGALHLLRLAVLDYHLRQGMVYPRWIPELLNGLGYPVFNFYGPLSYYLAELPHLLGLDLVSALVMAFTVWIVVAGFGMYRLAYDVLGTGQRWAALVAATAYMYAPYLLANVHVRGALAEVGAQALLPWIFWSVRRLLTAPRPAQYVLPVALTLGGLAITHNITLLFTPLALVTYALVIWWQAGHAHARLGWLAAALAAAMGVSAFFWLPMIGERQLLAKSAYEMAAVVLHKNVWTWRNFLNTNFIHEYSFDVTYQLGLVQAALALLGLLVARRRDPEWLYFLVLAVFAGLGISSWSLPLWLYNEILLVAQFPWRLLTFMSISLALFTGAILLHLEREKARIASACLLLALIIAANRPQVEWLATVAWAGENMTLPAIAQFEHDTNAVGLGSDQEFRPRWSTGDSLNPSGDDLAVEVPVDDRWIIVEQANAYSLNAAVSSSQGGPLRFTNLYYPAWRATLADGSALPTYPSTNLGLLTVDLPPGDQQLYLRWAGTDLQRLASWVSLLTLAALVVFTLRANRPRWLAVVPLCLLAFGLLAALARPSLAQVQTPVQLPASRSLQMAGYRLEQARANEIFVFPYWYAWQTPPADTVVRWQLRNTTGEVVGEVTARPYFNSQQASNWPPGTLVDDAYRLGLLPGLAAGNYELAVQITEDDDETAWTPVGMVTVAAPVPLQPQPSHQLGVRFGGLVELAGFDLEHRKADDQRAPERPVTVKPGDRLTYTLYWRPLQPLSINYHGLIHLIDRQGLPLVKRDQLAGSFSQAPLLWDSFRLQPDRYSVRIPKQATTGLYWPIVGLYEFETLELLPIRDATGQQLGNTFRLPPVKVFGNNPIAKPQEQMAAQLGDVTTLLGYDLSLPATELQPGSQFTVTLYYRVDQTMEQDLTHFVQLFSPDLGMAAQRDGPPQQGANPTWAWIPGEVVVDTFILQVRDDAMPGEYQLMVGLYNPVDGSRLPVQDAHRHILPDGQVRLTTLRVAP